MSTPAAPVITITDDRPVSWSEPDKQVCGTCGAMHFGRCPHHCDTRNDDGT